MRMMLAVVASAVLIGPCDPTGLKPPKDLAGMWGGENAALIADDSSAHIHIGCTYGDVHHRIIPDHDGRFDVPGEQNITAHPVDRGILHPARFVGRVIGTSLTLTVTLTDTTVTLGPVQVFFGKEPQMGPCPICRKPR